MSLTKNNVIFSIGQTGGIVITTVWPLPKTSNWKENWTKFGHFILRKIIKIVATRWEILRRKCTY